MRGRNGWVTRRVGVFRAATETEKAAILSAISASVDKTVPFGGRGKDHADTLG